MMEVPEDGAVFTLGKSYLSDNHQSYFFIKSDAVKKLITGNSQSAVICESGRLFVWGENLYGELGVGTTTNVTRPSCVKEIKNVGKKVKDVAFGHGFSVILTEDNNIYFCGKNLIESNTDFERLDYSKPHELNEFQMLKNVNGNKIRFIKVSAGASHFIALSDTGQAYGWGNNKNNQICGESNDVFDNPVKIDIQENIRIAECGQECSIFITDKNNIYITGMIRYIKIPKVTQINHTFINDEISYLHVTKTDNIYLIANQILYKSVSFYKIEDLHFEKFIPRDRNDKIIQISTGKDFISFVTDNGKFYTTLKEKDKFFNDNRFKDLSKFENLRISTISSGLHHILVHAFPRDKELIIENFKTLSIEENETNHTENIDKKGEIISNLNTTYNVVKPNNIILNMNESKQKVENPIKEHEINNNNVFDINIKQKFNENILNPVEKIIKEKISNESEEMSNFYKRNINCEDVSEFLLETENSQKQIIDSAKISTPKEIEKISIISVRPLLDFVTKDTEVNKIAIEKDTLNSNKENFNVSKEIGFEKIHKDIKQEETNKITVISVKQNPDLRLPIKDETKHNTETVLTHSDHEKFFKTELEKNVTSKEMEKISIITVRPTLDSKTNNFNKNSDLEQFDAHSNIKYMELKNMPDEIIPSIKEINKIELEKIDINSNIENVYVKNSDSKKISSSNDDIKTNIISVRPKLDIVGTKNEVDKISLKQEKSDISEKIKNAKDTVHDKIEDIKTTIISVRPKFDIENKGKELNITENMQKNINSQIENLDLNKKGDIEIFKNIVGTKNEVEKISLKHEKSDISEKIKNAKETIHDKIEDIKTTIISVRPNLDAENVQKNINSEIENLNFNKNNNIENLKNIGNETKNDVLDKMKREKSNISGKIKDARNTAKEISNNLLNPEIPERKKSLKETDPDKIVIIQNFDSTINQNTKKTESEKISVKPIAQNNFLTISVKETDPEKISITSIQQNFDITTNDGKDTDDSDSSLPSACTVKSVSINGSNVDINNGLNSLRRDSLKYIDRAMSLVKIEGIARKISGRKKDDETDVNVDSNLGKSRVRLQLDEKHTDSNKDNIDVLKIIDVSKGKEFNCISLDGELQKVELITSSSEDDRPYTPNEIRYINNGVDVTDDVVKKGDEIKRKKKEKYLRGSKVAPEVPIQLEDQLLGERLSMTQVRQIRDMKEETQRQLREAIEEPVKAIDVRKKIKTPMPVKRRYFTDNPFDDSDDDRRTTASLVSDQTGNPFDSDNENDNVKTKISESKSIKKEEIKIEGEKKDGKVKKFFKELKESSCKTVDYINSGECLDTCFCMNTVNKHDKPNENPQSKVCNIL